MGNIKEQQIPDSIRVWLNKRGIIDDVIKASLLSFDGRIIIPIFDDQGKFLFNKFRRDPSNEDGPKYTYEKGSTASLYNVGIFHRTGIINDPIFICEGELDCLALASNNIKAVSSTGGSGTFKKEWAEYFTQCPNVFICYDSDKAGTLGSLRVQQVLPHAKIIELPTDTKDVTDFLQKYSLPDLLLLAKQAETIKIPIEPDHVPKSQKELRFIIKKFSQAANSLLQEQRARSSRRISTRITEAAQALVMEKYVHYKNLEKNFDRPINTSNANDVAEARKVSVTLFLKVNNDGFAKCPFHNEKTASLKYYQHDNHLFCFGSCNRRFDVVDVVMHQQGIDFKTAVNQLIKKK